MACIIEDETRGRLGGRRGEVGGQEGDRGEGGCMGGLLFGYFRCLDGMKARRCCTFLC